MRFQIRERELVIRKTEFFKAKSFMEKYVEEHRELIVKENVTTYYIIGEPARLWQLLYEVTCDNYPIIID